MTASRTWRSRSFRDAAISAKLLIANNLARYAAAGQVTHQRVKPEPALRRADQALVADLGPTPLQPSGGRGRQRTAEGGNRQARIGAHCEIYPLQFPLLIGQSFLGRDGKSTCGDGATVRLPRRDVPAPYRAVERVGRGPEASVGASRPVGRVVTRAATITCGVRDLIELVAASRQPGVREQVLIGVEIVGRGRRRAARDPAGERRALLHGETVDREVSRAQGERLVQVTRPITPEIGGRGKEPGERDGVGPPRPQPPHAGPYARPSVEAGAPP